MWMVRLLGFRGREGGVGAEIVEVEGCGIGGEEERLGGLGVEDGGWVNRVASTAMPACQQGVNNRVATK